MLSEKTISSNLTRLMGEKGLNAHRLSLAANISYSRVADIMQGRTRDPRVSTLAPIAKELGVKIEDLIKPPVHPQ